MRVTTIRAIVFGAGLGVGCDGGPGTPSTTDTRDASAGDTAPDVSSPDVPLACDGPLLTLTWEDLGELPSTAGGVVDVALVGDRVVAATEGGIYTRDLGVTGTWAASGLAGLSLETLGQNPVDSAHLIAGLSAGQGATFSLGVSRDGGRTWDERGQNLGDLSFEPPFLDIAAHVVFTDDGATAFVNAGASDVAASSDGGATWAYIRGTGGALGYACQLLPAFGFLYQGCELPLDSAWVHRSPLTGTALGAEQSLIETDTLSNRRPNALVASRHVDRRVYVGVEGGLLRFEDTTAAWVFEAVEGGPDPYLYVRGVWEDPCDGDHLVFGGLVNDVTSGPPLRDTRDLSTSTPVELPIMPPPEANSAWGIERIRPVPGQPSMALLALSAGGSLRLPDPNEPPARGRVLLARFQ